MLCVCWMSFFNLPACIQLFESLKLLESNRQRIEKMAQMAGDSLANFSKSAMFSVDAFDVLYFSLLISFPHTQILLTN